MGLRYRNTISFDDYISKGCLLDPEKDISGCRFIFQKNREGIYSCKFSKVNVLIQGRLRAYNQEDTCLKFSQAKGNIKTILVTVILFREMFLMYPDNI